MSHRTEGALRLPDPDARVSVIQRLQAAADKHPPGTEKHERADLAISLALSPRRDAAVAPFLMRSVKRDARRIILHRPHHETLLTDLDAGTTAVAATDDSTEFDTIENRIPARRQATPDQEAIANELEARVRAAVRVLPYGEECLDGMIQGEPTEDTADRLGIEVHTVLRTRANIRWRAERVLA